MDVRGLAALVRRMRQSQRRYFATRDGGDLREAKRLEAEVDAAVSAVLAPETVETRPSQPGLFDGREIQPCD